MRRNRRPGASPPPGGAGPGRATALGRGGGRLNHCRCEGGSGPAPSGAAPGPSWTSVSTQWPRVVAAPGAAPRTAAVLARPAATSRRAPHWAKGRGAEGAASARQGRSASTPVPVPLLTRSRRHGEAAAAHQPLEELLRWRFRGRLPGVRGAPAGHHQGEVAWGARERGARPVLGAVRGTGGWTTAPGRNCAGAARVLVGAMAELQLPAGTAREAGLSVCAAGRLIGPL